MIDAKIRLEEEELELIRKNYPDIDIDNPLLSAVGMMSMTNLDMLLSEMKQDKSRIKDEDALKLYDSIIRKSEYFKAHEGRNFIEGYDIEKIFSKVDELSVSILGTKIDNQIFRIDQLINYARSLTKDLNEKQLESLIRFLGIALGELMLKQELQTRGYDWAIDPEYDYPVLKDYKNTQTIDPIAFVVEKLKYEADSLDHSGSCDDFFYKYRKQEEHTPSPFGVFPFYNQD